MSKSERLLNLYLFLLSSKTPVTLQDIGDSIPDYVDSSETAFKRMFHRDRNELRDKFGADIICHERLENVDDPGYSIASSSLLPPIDLTHEEALTIGLVRKAMETSGVFPPVESLKAAAQKLAVDAPMDGMWTEPQEPMVYVWEDAMSGVSPEVFMVLLDAVKDSKVVTFKYHAASRDAAGQYEAEPLAMSFCRGAWYLIARVRPDLTIRRLRLNRFETAPEIGDEIFNKDNFNIDDFKEQDVWEWGEDKEIVKVWVSKQKSHWLDSSLHTLLSREDNEDGSVKAAIEVNNCDLFVRELLKLGSHARVLGPDKVIDSMVDGIKSRHGVLGE